MPIAIQVLLLIPTMDEEAFIWLIRRQATNTQAESGCGHLHVAVEHAEQPGSVLVILTDRPHPQGWSQTNCEFIPVKPADGLPQEVKVWQMVSTQEVKPVRPSDVAQWIRQAVRLGWQPRLPGITFNVQIAGGRAKNILERGVSIGYAEDRKLTPHSNSKC